MKCGFCKSDSLNWPTYDLNGTQVIVITCARCQSVLAAATASLQ